MYFVGGPGPALHLNMGIPGPLNRIVLFYNVYTILYITIPYNFIILQYFTMYCKNINTLLFPRMFLL